MTIAVCLRCGEFKHGAYSKCSVCEYEPITNKHQAISILLSDHYCNEIQLNTHSSNIKVGHSPDVDQTELHNIMTSLDSPQGKALLAKFNHIGKQPKEHQSDLNNTIDSDKPRKTTKSIQTSANTPDNEAIAQGIFVGLQIAAQLFGDRLSEVHDRLWNCLSEKQKCESCRLYDPLTENGLADADLGGFYVAMILKSIQSGKEREVVSLMTPEAVGYFQAVNSFMGKVNSEPSVNDLRNSINHFFNIYNLNVKYGNQAANILKQHAPAWVDVTAEIAKLIIAYEDAFNGSIRILSNPRMASGISKKFKEMGFKKPFLQLDPQHVSHCVLANESAMLCVLPSALLAIESNGDNGRIFYHWNGFGKYCYSSKDMWMPGDFFKKGREDISLIIFATPMFEKMGLSSILEHPTLSQYYARPYFD